MTRAGQEGTVPIGDAAAGRVCCAFEDAGNGRGAERGGDDNGSIPYILSWTSAHERNSIYSVRFTHLRVSQIKKLNPHIPHFDALERDKERPPK